MTVVSIDQVRCDQSPTCPARRSCPTGAIVVTEQGYVVREDLCTGCGACMRVCPMRAISFSQEVHK